MGGLSSLRRLLEGPPVCPMCDGPCQHEFERGPYVFGGQDRNHAEAVARIEAEDAPKPQPTKGRRTRRAIPGPTETRHHPGPSEDR